MKGEGGSMVWKVTYYINDTAICVHKSYYSVMQCKQNISWTINIIKTQHMQSIYILEKWSKENIMINESIEGMFTI